MAINHFVNRDEDGRTPERVQLGDTVYIIEKENQGTRNPKDLVKGTVIRKLSKGDRYENGAKVMITLDPTDWRFSTMGHSSFIGRIQYTVRHANGEPIK